MGLTVHLEFYVFLSIPENSQILLFKVLPLLNFSGTPMRCRLESSHLLHVLICT